MTAKSSLLVETHSSPSEANEQVSAWEEHLPAEQRAIFRQLADCCEQFCDSPIGQQLGGVLLLAKCYPIIAELCGEDGAPWGLAGPAEAELPAWSGGVIFAAVAYEHPAFALAGQCEAEGGVSVDVSAIAGWLGISETLISDRGLIILSGLGVLPFDPRDLASLNAE